VAQIVALTHVDGGVVEQLALGGGARGAQLAATLAQQELGDVVAQFGVVGEKRENTRDNVVHRRQERENQC
jgi:hypothetical protein